MAELPGGPIPAHTGVGARQRGEPVRNIARAARVAELDRKHLIGGWAHLGPSVFTSLL
jgi:hypothetical protein